MSLLLATPAIFHKAASGGGGDLTSTYIDTTTEFRASSGIPAETLGIFDATSLAEGDTVYVLLNVRGTSGTETTALTLEGAGLTRVVHTSTTVSRMKGSIWKGTVNAAAAGNSAAELDSTGGGALTLAAVYKVVGTVTTETTVVDPGASDFVASRALDINTGASGVVLAVAGVEDSSPTPTITWTGITEDANATTTDLDLSSFASATTTAETPRSVSVSFTNYDHSGAAVVALS